jgi:deoxyribodipyrimidine photo-lyase
MAPKRKAAAIAANTYSDSTGSKANARSEASTTPTKRPKLSQMTLDGGISSMKTGSKKAPTITSFLKGAMPSSSNGTTSRNNISSNPGSTNPKIRYSHDFPFGSSDHCIERQFYPPEMSNERCAKYNANEIPRPIEVLQKAIAETKDAREAIRPGKAVLHWFKRDLRISDNRALAMASQKAKETGASLICAFVFSPQDYQAHLTSPVRVDFERRSLEVMKKDLANLDIPLYVYTVEHRKSIPDIFIAKCIELWDVSHVFCNIEYEVDELRREAKMTRMCLERGINFTAVHDDVVVTPGELKTGSGKQYAVYSPWYRNWLAYVNSHPHVLEAAPRPEKNPPIARQQFDELFCTPVPAAPENKKLTKDEKIRFAKLWPAGEHEALARVTKFISEKSKNYKDSRNYPDLDATAKISVHLSSGTLSARTCVRLARQAQSANKLGEGIETWISEVAWRDFYKHVLVHWPYVCMSKPFKYEYSNIEWEYSQELFIRWCGGKTGFPIGNISHASTL